MRNPKPATLVDLEQVPPNMVGELVAGELYASPRPAGTHTRAASSLGVELGGPFDRGRGGPGGWLILDEPEQHLGADVLVPDLAGWRRERMPKTLDVPFFTDAPDWVCEVLSPSTSRLDRGPKRTAYLREGVKHLWFVDPAARTLEVFRAEGQGWRLVATHVDQEVVRAEPFDAVPLELKALWV